MQQEHYLHKVVALIMLPRSLGPKRTHFGTHRDGDAPDPTHTHTYLERSQVRAGGPGVKGGGQGQDNRATRGCAGGHAAGLHDSRVDLLQAGLVGCAHGAGEGNQVGGVIVDVNLRGGHGTENAKAGAIS